MTTFSSLRDANARMVLAALLIVTASGVADESAWLRVAPDGAVSVQQAAPEKPAVVATYDNSGLDVAVDLRGIELATRHTEAGVFIDARLPGEPTVGQPGEPALPVVRRLFGAPVGAEVSLRIATGPPSVVDLAAAGFAAPLMPMQGPLSLDPHGVEAALQQEEVPWPLLEQIPESFLFEAAAYRSDALYPPERATITPVGIARDMQLYLLEVRPAAYNPAAGTIVLWPELVVQVDFAGGRSAWSHAQVTLGFEKVILNPSPVSRGARGGNFLLLVCQDLVDTAPLNQFVAAKTAQGFNVIVQPVPVNVNPEYIKSTYIESLWGTPDAPDYVVVMGDADYHTWYTGTWFIPAWNSHYPRAGRTDLYYACMDGPNDWMPDMAWGRMPARDPNQLQVMVDKSLQLEQGPYPDPAYTGRAAMIAGPEPYADGEARNDYIIETYLDDEGLTTDRLYSGAYGADTQAVADAVNDGRVLVSFFGHAGGFQAWADPTFVFSDIEALTNVGRYPFLVSFSCSGSAFHYTEPTQSPGFCEKWLKEADKGAAIAYGHSWSLDPYTFDAWGVVYNGLYRGIYGDDIRELGPAANAASAYLVQYYGPDEPVSRDFTEEFLLLGDPTLYLPEPPLPNYLIITAQEYMGTAALSQFIAQKEAQGLNVIVYEAAPGKSNNEIKSYIATLLGTPDEPDYILLVGDTDGYTATVDCVPHFQGGGSKNADTDWPYGCFDGGDDWYPDVPVGRFSCRSPAVLQAIVDKVISVESGNYADPDYVTRGAFLANPSTYGQAEPTHDWVINNYFEPNGYRGIRLYAAEGAGTADVADAINGGALFAVYFGHSSSSGWWDPSFGSDDVEVLSNRDRYGIVFGFSCNTSRYSYSECFGETWQREADKGAAAYISASTYIYWGSVQAWQPSVVLEKAFFASFFEDDIWTLGPAWVNGLYRFLEEHGGWDGNHDHDPPVNEDVCRNFFEEFVILGDPAMRVPQPSMFSMEVTPSEQSVCAPQTPAFDVAVAKLGSFNQPVTLSADNLPAGTSASFTDNDVVPPFTSSLVIQDTDLAQPGSYDIEVVATAGSKVRSQVVTLYISSELPGATQLLSPADGATDVAREPTLSWEAAAHASTYKLEIATDATMYNTVYSTSVTDTTLTLEVSLDPAATYYWHVRPENGCGLGDFTTPFSFTTIEHADYFTEQFTGGGDSVDLDGYTLALIPDGGGSFYHACREPAAELPIDPAGGQTLSLGDDASQTVTPGQSVQLYGNAYSSFYVNSNGNITFESSDNTYSESLTDHFNQPRVSPLFDDLNPSSGGTVSWKQTADAVAVTWEDVPEYSSTGSNTFQVAFHSDGSIRMTWLGITCGDAIVGVSNGTGVEDDFTESDLSAYMICAEPAVGACCTGDVCAELTEADCAGTGGTWQGAETSCTPNPCIAYSSSCLIISEVVRGAESGACPRFVELTNTGNDDFLFLEGGLIVQTGDSQDLVIDVDLTGGFVPAGGTFVLVSNASGSCTGAFDAIFGMSADMYTNVTFGYGDERYILTDTDDASSIVDIYGEFGVDGTGQPWELTDGYAYRLPVYLSGHGAQFEPNEWHFGGVGSLAGGNPTQALLDYTTPGYHNYKGACAPGCPGDGNCDGQVNWRDIDFFVAAQNDNVSAWQAMFAPGAPTCPFTNNDTNDDGAVNWRDIDPFVAVQNTTCP